MQKASRSRREDWAQVVYALALSGRALAEEVAIRCEVSRVCLALNGLLHRVCSWAFAVAGDLHIELFPWCALLVNLVPRFINQQRVSYSEFCFAVDSSKV